MRIRTHMESVPEKVATIWNWWSSSAFTFADPPGEEMSLTRRSRSATAEGERFMPRLVPLRR